MGFEIKFNWALQVDEPDNLSEGGVYDFVKNGNRAFPIEIPIDLINLKREAVAKVHILEFSNTKTETRGKYEVIKIYKGEEKAILSNYWIENK